MAEIEFVRMSKRYADGEAAVSDLSLEVADGEFLILVGPSGCGKSTALRTVAGLEEISEGSVKIDGQIVNDIPPAERDVAMVFQTYALYPHLTVAANIGFPLKMTRVRPAEARQRVLDAARLLDIEELLERKPGELSGGQRQRVAMGRAIVRKPRAFLMDEPLSNLDAKLRVQMRAELVNLHKRLGVTTLYVTHDQVEAMTLGDRVAVMCKGVMQQVGSPNALYRQPTNTYVASFIGSPPMNFLSGRLTSERLVLDGATGEPERRWDVPDGEVLVGVRPEALAQAADDLLAGQFSAAVGVDIVEDLGAESIVHVRPSHITPAEIGERPVELRGTLAMRIAARTKLTADDKLRISFAAEDLHLFDPGSGKALAHPAL